MKIVCFYSNDSKLMYQKLYVDAFMKGLKRHDINAVVTDDETVIECDLAVFWSHRKKLQIKTQKQNGADYLVMERGYIGDRMGSQISLAFNGLNGEAEFVDNENKTDRWQQWKHLLKPWRKDGEGDYWLIASQVPGDASLKGLDINEWCYKQKKKIASFDSARKSVIRWHPMQNKNDDQPTLEEHLSKAYAVITYSSNIGVDAILYGVPVVSFGECSMVKLVSSNSFKEVIQPCRDEWANWLAYCQWSIDEIREGIAWEHLRKRYS